MGNNALAPVPQGNSNLESWRDHIEVHPACELFPSMTPDELRSLSEDIKANGLQTPITVMVDRADNNGKWSYKLLDGRNRLDAIALGGFNSTAPSRSQGRAHRRRNGMDCGLDFNLGLPDRACEGAAINYIRTPDNPYAFIVSANIHRRHLTAAQKNELIGKLLKAAPEKSDRQIAKTVKADNKTVAKVRREQEGREEIPHVEARIDTKGRKQPSAKKPATKQAPKKRSMAQAIREQTAGADMYVAAKKFWHKMPHPDQDRFLSYLTDGGYDGTAFVLKRAPPTDDLLVDRV
jgi:hypothetical protein